MYAYKSKYKRGIYQACTCALTIVPRTVKVTTHTVLLYRLYSTTYEAPGYLLLSSIPQCANCMKQLCQTNPIALVYTLSLTCIFYALTISGDVPNFRHCMVSMWSHGNQRRKPTTEIPTVTSSSYLRCLSWLSAGCSST